MEGSNFIDGATGARLRHALGQAAQDLARAGIGSAALDAEVLLGQSLALTREQLLVQADITLGPAQVKRFAALLARRLEREPVAYIIGRQEFWSLDFLVTPDVLIPRPETECLIEVALRLAAQRPAGQPLRVLDVGTGSGAIAVVLAQELPSARLYATDISLSALTIARHNARINGVFARVAFLCGDMFGALSNHAARFDLILSNPPYIRRADIAGLAPEVSRWEPRAALDGGTDGMDFYRRIAARAGEYLAPNGVVAVEIGAEMGASVSAIFAHAGLYRDTELVHDYAGRERVVVARAGTYQLRPD